MFVYSDSHQELQVSNRLECFFILLIFDDDDDDDDELLLWYG